MGNSVNRLHFDEAWYGYAKFNPLYCGRFAMDVEVHPDDDSRPTIFATQSTHKLLAALSQASMIHIKSSGRAPVEHGRFNEAFMMHSSTSPQYVIIASNDVAAAMMEGKGGGALTDESIAEAVDFRQMMARLRGELEAKNDWWFTSWQPEEVLENVNFEDADPKVLCTSPECWVLKPDAKWHGFEGRRLHLKTAMAAIRAYERPLVERLIAGLKAIPGVTVYGIADLARFEQRAPTVAFTLE